MIQYIFSYWIFAWFIVYKLFNIQYNPKFVIILGIIANIIVLLHLIYKGASLYSITKFISINIIIKGIPYYLLRNDIIKLKDIYASIILFMIYLIYSNIRNINIIDQHKKLSDEYINQ
jgi:hypothetical protein